MKVYAKEKVSSVIPNAGESSVNIQVTLLDANDNNPTFVPTNLYDFVVTTQAAKGDIGNLLAVNECILKVINDTLVGQIHAIDPDLGMNGLVIYSLQKTSNNTNPFDVDPKTGKIIVAESTLVPGKHILFIEAADQPSNPSEKRTSLAVVTVDVKNHKGF